MAFVQCGICGKRITTTAQCNCASLLRNWRAEIDLMFGDPTEFDLAGTFDRPAVETDLTSPFMD